MGPTFLSSNAAIRLVCFRLEAVEARMARSEETSGRHQKPSRPLFGALTLLGPAGLCSYARFFGAPGLITLIRRRYRVRPKAVSPGTLDDQPLPPTARTETESLLVAGTVCISKGTLSQQARA